MTSFLRSLLAREGSANLLRPRPVARFEGGLGAGVEASPAAASSAVSPVARPHPARAAAPVGLKPTREPAPLAAFATTTARAPEAGVVARATHTVQSAVPTELPRAPSSESAEPRAAEAGRTVTREIERSSHETVVRERSSVVVRELASDASELAIVVAPSAGTSAQLPPTTVSPPAGPRPREPAAPAAAPAPSLQISIGRIELRAVSPAAPPAPRRSVAPAALGLEQYLSQRGGGKP